MKKIFMSVVAVVACCVSFAAGNTVCRQNMIESRNRKCNTLISFAVDKLDTLKNEYDSDVMEAVISNIYAAYEYCDEAEMKYALHNLWNALIFDGENINGNESELISALQNFDAEGIKYIVYDMRLKG